MKTTINNIPNITIMSPELKNQLEAFGNSALTSVDYTVYIEEVSSILRVL